MIPKKGEGEVKVLKDGQWVPLGSGTVSYGVESMEIVPKQPEPEPEQFCDYCLAGMESSEHHQKCVVPAILSEQLKATKPEPGPGGYLTTGQMEQWLKTLTAKLPADTYLVWDDQAGQTAPTLEIKPLPEIKGYPADTQGKPLASTNAEDPATAPCRVFWNSHVCDKPRIHVLPGHPAGPEHECGWGKPGGGSCSKVDAEGQRLDWNGAFYSTAGEWELVGPVELYGEDAPG